jgi:hypothetical protein
VQAHRHQNCKAVKHREQPETLVEIGRLYIVAPLPEGIVISTCAGFLFIDWCLVLLTSRLIFRLCVDFSPSFPVLRIGVPARKKTWAK